MREQKSKFIKWVKNHKKELILAGVSLTAIILAIRNRDSINMLWEYLKKRIEEQQTKIPPNSCSYIEKITVFPSNSMASIPESHLETAIPINVREHIRNLPNGHHPSPEKVADALELNIPLKPNQTWVKPYIRERNVA